MTRTAMVLAAVLTVVAASASATSVQFDQITPSEPALANYVSNVMKIDLPGQWAEAQLRINGLASGMIYQHLLGADTPPNPVIFGIDPNVEADTFVANGGLDTTTSAGVAVWGAADGLGGGPTSVFSDQEIDVKWRPATGAEPQNVVSYPVGQFTISKDVSASYSALVMSGDGSSVTYNGQIVGGVMYDPTGFIRGDANDDTQVNIADPIYTVNHLFNGLPPTLPVPDAADANDDGRLDIADADYTLKFLFTGGPKPPDPFFPGGPGPDTTPAVTPPSESSALSLVSPSGNSINAVAGQTFQIPIEVQLDVDPTNGPVTAFSVAVQTSDGTFIDPQIGVAAEYAVAEIDGAGTGAIGAAIISLTDVTGLAGADHVLLELMLEGTAPALGDMDTWNLSFQTLTGSGQPVENIVSVSGTPFAPTTSNLSIRVTGASPIPEPATLALLGLAACGLGGYVRRRRKA